MNNNFNKYDGIFKDYFTTKKHTSDVLVWYDPNYKYTLNHKLRYEDEDEGKIRSIYLRAQIDRDERKSKLASLISKNEVKTVEDASSKLNVNYKIIISYLKELKLSLFSEYRNKKVGYLKKSPNQRRYRYFTKNPELSDSVELSKEEYDEFVDNERKRLLNDGY